MQELLTYINMIKRILDRHYEKEIVFYDNGSWYSREHCREISLEELEDFLLEVTDKPEYHI